MQARALLRHRRLLILPLRPEAQLLLRHPLLPAPRVLEGRQHGLTLAPPAGSGSPVHLLASPLLDGAGRVPALLPRLAPHHVPRHRRIPAERGLVERAPAEGGLLGQALRAAAKALDGGARGPCFLRL